MGEDGPVADLEVRDGEEDKSVEGKVPQVENGLAPTHEVEWQLVQSVTRPFSPWVDKSSTVGSGVTRVLCQGLYSVQDSVRKRCSETYLVLSSDRVHLTSIV